MWRRNRRPQWFVVDTGGSKVLALSLSLRASLRERETECYSSQAETICCWAVSDVLPVIVGRHIMTGSYNNFFRMFDRDLKRDTTLEASSEVTKPRTALRPRKVCTTGGGGKRKKDEIGVDCLDFSRKILHTGWHPAENIVAIAATNNLYIFCSKDWLSIRCWSAAVPVVMDASWKVVVGTERWAAWKVVVDTTCWTVTDEWSCIRVAVVVDTVFPLPVLEFRSCFSVVDDFSTCRSPKMAPWACCSDDHWWVLCISIIASVAPVLISSSLVVVPAGVPNCQQVFPFSVVPAPSSCCWW